MKEWVFKGTDDGHILNNEPAQEIIRCKDCKWFDPFPMCGLLGTSDIREDFFCADGERK